MAKFYDANPVFADKIATVILEFTSQRMAAEQQALEDAEKNSEATRTKPSSEDGAESTGKTPEPPESAESNCSDSQSTNS
jgi:hypothetical protein